MKWWLNLAHSGGQTLQPLARGEWLTDDRVEATAVQAGDKAWLQCNSHVAVALPCARQGSHED